MGFVLSKKSLAKLDGVHLDLVKVVKLAITMTGTDFMVSEGLRSVERQKALVAKGVSRTMASKHLRQTDGYGHAVDLYPLAGGKPVMDWGKPWPGQAWADVSRAMKEAAAKLGVKITWGGDWATFKDGPHYQLEKK